MAQNPDPNLPLTSIKGVTRSLDDWATIFNLAIVLLPARSEASAWVPVVERMYKTLGDSDVRTCICIDSTPAIVRRIIGDLADRYLTFCDPDQTRAGLERERMAEGRRRDRASCPLDCTRPRRSRKPAREPGLGARSLRRREAPGHGVFRRRSRHWLVSPR
jgi:hypothetical protein